MTWTTIWSMFTKILDICIIWLMLYYILKNVRNNVKLTLIVKGIILLLVIKLISSWLDLYTVGLLLEYIISWGPIAIIIIFHPEIRNVLESIGRTQILGRHKTLTGDERERVVHEIMIAIEYTKRNKMGCLIAIERDVSLRDYIEPAVKVYADLSGELLSSIFYPNSPLHDGGVIIQGNRITCARAVFKTSMDPSVSKKLGTRHRAALGIAEETDAIALVVSEESGKLSIAVDSHLYFNLTIEEFKMRLIEELRPKAEIFYEADEEEVEEDE